MKFMFLLPMLAGAADEKNLKATGAMACEGIKRPD
jgi:hypothetical protein